MKIWAEQLQWSDSCPSCAKRSLQLLRSTVLSVSGPAPAGVLASPSLSLLLLRFTWSCSKDWIFPNAQSSSRLPGPPLWICLQGKGSPFASLGWVRSYPLQRFNKMWPAEFCPHCYLPQELMFLFQERSLLSQMPPQFQTCPPPSRKPVFPTSLWGSWAQHRTQQTLKLQKFVELCGDGGTGTTLWMCKMPLNCSFHNG